MLNLQNYWKVKPIILPVGSNLHVYSVNGKRAPFISCIVLYSQDSWSHYKKKLLNVNIQLRMYYKIHLKKSQDFIDYYDPKLQPSYLHGFRLARNCAFDELGNCKLNKHVKKNIKIGWSSEEVEHKYNTPH